MDTITMELKVNGVTVAVFSMNDKTYSTGTTGLIGTGKTYVAGRNRNMQFNLQGYDIHSKPASDPKPTRKGSK